MAQPLQPFYDRRRLVFVPALPHALNERLLAHCARSGEHPDDVLADALTLHLDASEDWAVEAQVEREVERDPALLARRSQETPA